ncbi:hypothetical protein TNCV_4755851 [Trichonephila clavipes]|nr:hypothetical protein TNCV_4755851 [Trichonephila clavipes]
MLRGPQFTRFCYRKSSAFGNSTPSLCELTGSIPIVLSSTRSFSVLSSPSFSLIRGLLNIWEVALKNSLLAFVKIKVEIISTGMLDNRGRRATEDQLQRLARPIAESFPASEQASFQRVFEMGGAGKGVRSVTGVELSPLFSLGLKKS